LSGILLDGYSETTTNILCLNGCLFLGGSTRSFLHSRFPCFILPPFEWAVRIMVSEIGTSDSLGFAGPKQSFESTLFCEFGHY
jgi:hypothetical protein